MWERTDSTGPELWIPETGSPYHTPGRAGAGHLPLKHRHLTQVEKKTLCFVIYSMGQTEPTPPSLTTPPKVVEIKVTASFSGEAERKALWNVGIPATQLPWLGAHKLSKPPGSATGLLHLLTQGS